MLTLVLLAGIWSSTCIQTQTPIKQGFTIETYEFAEAGDFIFSRQWFQDSECKSATSTDQQIGTVKIGKEVSSMFNPNTFEADFKTLEGADYGVLSLTGKNLKVGRGFLNSQMRNTMPGVFNYAKKD